MTKTVHALIEEISGITSKQRQLKAAFEKFRNVVHTLVSMHQFEDLELGVDDETSSSFIVTAMGRRVEYSYYTVGMSAAKTFGVVECAREADDANRVNHRVVDHFRFTETGETNEPALDGSPLNLTNLDHVMEKVFAVALKGLGD